MTAAEIIMAVIGTGGLAALAPKIIDGWKAMSDGRAAREKAENRSALGRLTRAEEDRDNEANFRRQVEEWAGQLVYMLVKLGVPVDQIPGRPERTRDKERV